MIEKKAGCERPILLVSESFHNADMYYATKFQAPDRFVYFCSGTRETLLVSVMEQGRAKKESCVKDVRTTDDYGYTDRLKELKDQDRALAELFRVMAPHGRLFILINLYKDNPYALQWVPKLKVPVHVRSAAEYVELLKKHAFGNVEYALISDDTPTPDNYQTTSFHSLDDLKAFKRIGALLLMASKPDVRNPAPGYTIY